MGRINAEDKLNMLIRRQSSYCVEKQESTTEYFQKRNSAWRRQPRRVETPPTLNKIQLKAKTSELGL